MHKLHGPSNHTNSSTEKLVQMSGAEESIHRRSKRVNRGHPPSRLGSWVDNSKRDARHHEDVPSGNINVGARGGDSGSAVGTYKSSSSKCPSSVTKYSRVSSIDRKKKEAELEAAQLISKLEEVAEIEKIKLEINI